ncbi:hypothetical protein FMUND_12327 [Fusarium mundagurra]|uniref:Mid2 domain-containing protein n=1 Tax=Fusarium mundagurra TaxID=1567541 RepID=A0A8H5Y328_9HYPO|nr:hypothetical protein FMUND_12327 [Fusarium mundagurra]
MLFYALLLSIFLATRPFQVFGSASVVRAGNTPDYTGYNTLGLVRRTPARPSRHPKDTKQKNSTSLDTSWVNAILFAYTGEEDLGSKQGNSSVSASIEITCATCYIKGTATTEFIHDREFNISRAFSNFTSQVRREIDNLADETADYIEKYIDTVADNLDDGFDLDDFDLPPLDYNLNVDIPEIPEFRLQFQFDGLEVYMLIDTVLSAGATYTLNLYTSTTPAGFAVRDNLELGVIFAIDLILSVEGEINISSGFHLRLDDGVLFDIAIFSKKISNLTINGGDFEFLPVTIESAGVVFKAVLRVGVKAGFEIASPEVSIAGKTIAHVGGGVEVGVFANIAELITNVTLSTDEDDDCSLRVEEVYQLAVGAAAGASIAIDDMTWGPVPETEIPVFYTTLGHACASQRSSDASLSVTTSPALRVRGKNDDGVEMETTTISTKATFTVVACQSEGLVNCPMSLQTTSKYTTTRTHVTVVPTDGEAEFPESVSHTVTSLVPFGKGANKLVAMSGTPSSYVPPTTTSSAKENGNDDDSNGTSNVKSGGVSKSVIIGVSVGLGVPFLLGAIAVILLLRRKKNSLPEISPAPAETVESTLSPPKTHSVLAENWFQENLQIPDRAAVRAVTLTVLSQTKLEYTVVSNGHLFDYCGYPKVKSYLKHADFLVDIANKAAAVPGSGEDKVVFTYRFDVARFVDALVNTDKRWPKHSVIIGEKIMANEIVAIAEAARVLSAGISSQPQVELPSHVEAYKFFPKPMLQTLFAVIGLWIIEGHFDLPYGGLLNQRFSHIEFTSVKQLIDQAWKA